LIDPRGLAQDTAQNGIPVPALIARFQAEMLDGDAAQYVHWGATTQDIMDSGLALRLRQVVAIYEARLKVTIAALAALAETHRSLPMAARTWGVAATPTSFGAIVASWGVPLIRHLGRLQNLKADLLCVSLSGAAGTLSAMGPDGPEVRAELARGLGLNDPGSSWHSTRDGLVTFTNWAAALTGSLGKMGEDLLLLTRTGEVHLSGGGASSTMPQKQNPVTPSLLVALGRQMVGLAANMQAALPHRDQRDGAAWMVEWMTLPQMCMITGRALTLAGELPARVAPQPHILLGTLEDGLELIYAEALTFFMARKMPRPDAQAAVKELCTQARALNAPLSRMATKRWPDQDFGPLFTPQAQLSDAPSEADRFNAEAKLICA
jgi:3-carboxy-cis,cis-muconate cycloisomerase